MAIVERIKYAGPSDVLAWKWPSETITLGSQLIVNQSQEAVFFRSGAVVAVFGPGRHTLASANLPFLAKVLARPFGATPFPAEVYFVNKTVGLALEWGTKTPIVVLDPRYRVSVPLRAYGGYGVRVVDATAFVTEVVGALPTIERGAVGATHDQAVDVLASPIQGCLQQALGSFAVERKISALDLPAHTHALQDEVVRLLGERHRLLGLELVNFTVESINFDPDDPSVRRLREALDEAARLDIVGDSFQRNREFYSTDRQFDVLEKAAGTEGGVMGAAVGLGVGFGVAGTAGQIARDAMQPGPTRVACPACGQANSEKASFCAECGARLVASVPCPGCGTGNAPGARFCSECGAQLGPRRCGGCGAELPPDARFCSECGTRSA